MTTKQPYYVAAAEGYKASQWLARLKNCRASGARYLDSEMRACQIKIEFQPDYKAVFQEVATSANETMADFIKTAVQERMVRILNQRVADGEAAEREAA